MNHAWADSDTNCLGKFSSTRGNLYWRIVFWLVVECLSLASLFYTIMLDPNAPVGSQLRSILSVVTPVLCLVSTIPISLLLINCIRLFRPRDVVCVYNEGFAIKSTGGQIRRAYKWKEIQSIQGDTSFRNTTELAHGLSAVIATALLFLLPIAVELGFTGRLLEITTTDGRRLIVDRRFPKRKELATLLNQAASSSSSDTP